MSDPSAVTTANRAPRQTRRLSDHIRTAFHQACDQRDLEVAERLLSVLEMAVCPRLLSEGTPDRRDQDSLVAAYERLWQLRHPDPIGGSDAPVDSFPSARSASQS
jgi:hypothetical protein